MIETGWEIHDFGIIPLCIFEEFSGCTPRELNLAKFVQLIF